MSGVIKMNIHNPIACASALIPMLKKSGCTHFQHEENNNFSVFGIEKCSKCHGNVRSAENFKLMDCNVEFLNKYGFIDASHMIVATDGYADDEYGDCCSNCN